MPMRPGNAEYLGDGVYASFDGYGVSVDLRGEGRPEKIVLEPEVFENLKQFADRAFEDVDTDGPDFDGTTEPQASYDEIYQQQVDMCDTSTWTVEQIEAMRRRFPGCLSLEKEPQYVSGECGKWVHFAEAIPDDEHDVLVTDGRIVQSALWAFDGLHFPAPEEDDDEFIESVTHWMKYPDPPATQTDVVK